jgi:hypothetical protein
LKFLLAVRRRVKYALIASETPSQTGALVCIYPIYCLVLRFAITVTYYDWPFQDDCSLSTKSWGSKYVIVFTNRWT